MAKVLMAGGWGGQRWGGTDVPIPDLGDLKDVEFTGVFEGLPAVAEPDADDFAVVVEFLGDLGDLLAGGQGVLLEVGVESLDGLGGEGSTALPFFGGFPPHELHQVLLPLLVTELSFAQPLLQHRFELLGALGGDVQLLEPAAGTEEPSGTRRGWGDTHRGGDTVTGLGALLLSAGETTVGSEAAVRSFVGSDPTHPPFLPFPSLSLIFLLFFLLFSSFPPFLHFPSSSPIFLPFPIFPFLQFSSFSPPLFSNLPPFLRFSFFPTSLLFSNFPSFPQFSSFSPIFLSNFPAFLPFSSRSLVLLLFSIFPPFLQFPLFSNFFPFLQFSSFYPFFLFYLFSLLLPIFPFLHFSFPPPS